MTIVPHVGMVWSRNGTEFQIRGTIAFPRPKILCLPSGAPMTELFEIEGHDWYAGVDDGSIVFIGHADQP